MERESNDVVTPGKRSGRPLPRRLLLGSGVALGGATALLTGGVAAQGGRTPTYDVACDGRTFVLNRTSPPSELPRRGDEFIVNGKIYPAGTIDRGLTGPDQPGSIGTWVCRGTFYVMDIASQTPHVVSLQLYQLDTGDALVSEGFEGGAAFLRAVIGGMGAHLGARGEVTEAPMGENNTLLNLGPAQVPAPNLRFTFTLRG